MTGKSSDTMRWLVSVALAAVVAYYTAMGAIQTELASIKARQESQFQEVLRRLDLMQADIRELRQRQP